jgi:outer membrane protein assembly factor BamE
MNLTKRALYLFAGAFLLIAETGCFQPYRIDVQQGNVVTREQIERLQTGMTRREAQFVLGTPLIEDPFHANRWDYLFSLRQGETGHTNQSHLTLFFEGDSLVEIRYKEID